MSRRGSREEGLESRLAGLSPAQRALLLARLRRKAGRPPEAIPRRSLDGALPLSFAQQRMWFLDAVQPGSAAFHVAVAYRLQGPLEVALLDRAQREIVRRHATLRTRFPGEEGGPVARVPPGPAPWLPVVDLSRLPAAPRWEEARERVEAGIFRPFDLAGGAGYRPFLVRLEGREHLLVVVIHHIVADGWSLGVFCRELAQYLAFQQGRGPALPALPLQYPDYAAWQRQRLAGERLDGELAYWRRRLAGAPRVLDLPADRPRPPVASLAGAHLPWRLPDRLTAALQELGGRSGATLFATLLAAFTAWLDRLSGEGDLLVGIPVASRQRPELEGLIGLFVNTLVFRARRQEGAPFSAHLEQVRRDFLEDREHQELPFEKLVEELRPERDPGRPPLVQVMLAFEEGRGAGLELPGLTCRPLPLRRVRAQLELTLSLVATERGVGGWWIYATDRFDATTVRRLAGSFERFLAAAAAHPEIPLDRLPLLSPAERHALTREVNDTAALPEAPPFPAQVAARAAAVPEAVALAWEGEVVSYGELLARARGQARRLRRLGAGSGLPVALAAGRSPALVEGLLGILAAGAAFVPLDPTYPEERLAFMLADALDRAEPRLLLAGEADAPGLTAPGVRRVALAGTEPEEGEGDGGFSALAGDFPPQELAYVIYTSGSTGKPKGVQICHRGLANLSRELARTLAAGPGDRVLQFASLSFDAAVLEVALALAGGATLVLAPAPALLPGEPLAALLARRAVSHSLLPPSALATLERDAFPLLHTLIAGGEECPPELAARWCRGRRVMNAYGPTEVTVVAAWWRAPAPGLPPGRRRLSIGRPLGNLTLAVVDRRLRQQPPAAPGELCVGGLSLARGYLHRPALTAGRFVPDPFGGAPGARLYRTGDRARVLADGQAELLGRIDHQVKVRGFRVEPGEVESALAEHPGVREAVVVARGEPGSAERRLVAWVVTRGQKAGSDEAGVSAGELRTFLAGKLPAHLVPSRLVLVADLPRTPGGKVDRRALQSREAGPVPGDAPAEGRSPIPPRSSLESFIAGVWREVLEVSRVGVHDSFFDLGGHSLLLARVHQALRRRFPGLAMVDLFRYPTVATLARHLDPGGLDTAEGGPAPAPATAPAAVQVPAVSGEVAILAMVGRFPGAPDLDTFWHNLASGVESITFFSDDELLAAGSDPAVLRHPAYVPASGVLADVELFDPELFGLSPREAEVMDPQHRLLLECAWQACEQAGYDPGAYPGRVGVFAGTSANTYRGGGDGGSGDDADPLQVMLGNDGAFAASRVSYKLDLRGPSLHLQTACSTSLVAVHLACRSLLAGECDMALAGGVGLALPQQRGYLYQPEGINSPDGHCRAFDAAARGTVGGNGVGLVLLKRLADARADGDPIRAVVQGSAVNNDGALKVGYTAPGVDGQAAVLAAALANAGVAPETVGYVEAHGSGTALGDPVEMAALIRVYGGARRPPGSCAVGSVKTNIGHLDAAAGIAGLIKAVLALEHGVVPPSLHFQEPNPEIDFDGGRFFVPVTARPWPVAGRPRRAAVSSFGLGGTNAHVVLEEARVGEEAPEEERSQLILLSARSAAGLAAAGRDLADHLERHSGVPLADLAYTLQTGRRPFSHRRMLVCRRREELPAALAEEPRPGATAVVEPFRLGSEGRPVVFLLPGAGEQYPGMARELYAHPGTFRRCFDRYAERLALRLGVDLRELLFAGAEATAATLGQEKGGQDQGGQDEGGPDLRALLGQSGGRELEATDRLQPLLVALELALARQWMDWGVRPRALLGYSVGEYTAACLAGVLEEEEALELVAERGRLIQSLPPGAMLALPLGEEEALPLLGGALAVAAVNGPALSVVAGPPAEVAALAAELAARGVVARRLPTRHAFHSPMMQPVAAAFRRRVSACRLRPPRVPYLSNVTGDWITPGEATDPGYWVEHLLRPVRFGAALDRLLGDGERCFLEVGPGQSLSVLVRQHPGRAAGQPVVATLRHRHERIGDREFLLDALGRLWLAGVAVDWPRLWADRRLRRIALPPRPLERRRCWREAPAGRGERPASGAGVAPARPDLADWFYVPLWQQDLAPEVAASEESAAAGPWLLFADAGGLAEALARCLAARGAEVVLVLAGEEFAAPSPGRFVLRPGRREDYRRLLESLDGSAPPPAGVVHLWTVDPPAGDSSLAPLTQAEVALERGFWSLLALTQAWGELLPGQPLGLTVVSRGLWEVVGGEEIHSAHATLLGPCLVIPQEVANARCRSVDVAAAGEGAAWPRELVDGLLAEIAAGRERVVALRGRRRWVRRFHRRPLAPGTGANPRLRRGGVYLITGGLGGMGLVLAEHLARCVGARLALLSRSALPPRREWVSWRGEGAGGRRTRRRLDRLLALEALGAQVLPLQADVADPVAVERAVGEVHRRLGPIAGVIHAAGLPAGGLIQLKTPATAAPVMAPKVQGTLVLAEALRGEELDFFVLCSSLAAVVGSLGQVEYCAANAFLDAFARRRAAAGETVLAIAWDSWREAGMAVEPLAELPFDWEERLEEKISNAEGVEVFDRVLRSGLAEVAVVTEELAELEARARGRRPRPPARPRETHPRPDLGRAYTAPRDQVERTLAGIWQELLGLEQVGVDDPFQELGGHSLTALRVLGRVRDELAVALPLQAVYEHPTIAELASAIQRRRSPAPGADPRAGDSPLVALQGEGSRPPLIWVHPAGGGVLSYRDLARRLGAEQPFWGLVARGLERDEAPLTGIPEMAAYYLAAVCRRVPEGPYLLAGWSVGGLIAYEMARQLRDAGREVALLILLDTRLPASGGAGELEGEEDDALLSDLFHLPHRPTPGLSPAERTAQVIGRARQAGRIPASFDDASARRLVRVFKSMARAVSGYRPRPCPGRLTLLRPAVAAGNEGPDPTLGWGELAAGGVDLQTVPGEHWNMVFEPHAEELAQAVQARVDAVVAQASTLNRGARSRTRP